MKNYFSKYGASILSLYPCDGILFIQYTMSRPSGSKITGLRERPAKWNKCVSKCTQAGGMLKLLLKQITDVPKWSSWNPFAGSLIEAT